MNQLASENKKIGWPEISSKRYGGVIHRAYIRKLLAKKFDLEFMDLEAKYFNGLRYLKLPESFIYLLRLKGEKDLWIRDFYSTVTLRRKKTKGKNLVLIHHLDFSGFPLISRPFLNLMTKFFFFHNLKKVDAIVTISEYWKNYFIEKGFFNVYKIYGGFDLIKYNVSDEDVLEFQRKYKLEGRPIVYLGNCQRGKGVIDSWRILKDLDIYLVTSGQRQVNIPILNLDLSYEDYLKLLKASSIVLTMSKFKEGWCRTAHEAMLLKTPVIGSGRGGMRELLEGGGQIICQDFKNLKEKVKYLLNNPKIRNNMVEKGFNFAKEFSLEKLEENWLNLINKILK